ncbi:DUF4440 domain-containing protein [Thiomonas sp. FB-6]|uniref:nuclear transport factor 2 family protein n=1 Tax=Thiomonas sp. FB-6 TaxID=1158291 RepID=UPI0003672E17|nr:nuclear transport factor 2 family protein [Thiomonas sp. FB-6]
MKRNLAAELAEGCEALAVNRLSQRALPPPEVESMTPPSDPMEDLAALERELHDPAVRRDRARVDALLHQGFEEVGRSGIRYTRAETIAALASEGPSRAAITSDAFALTALGADAALLTYRTAERLADGSDIRHAHRCSLWLRVEGRWQVRYHQATPTTESPG